MVRYKVTIAAPGDGHSRPVLVVPFEPDALVTAFIDELFKRIARHGSSVKPDTHIATLRLDSETGAVLDYEDLLVDVIGEDERDKVFMVLKEKVIEDRDEPTTPGGEAHVRVRIITPARARETAVSVSAYCIDVPKTASVHELHQRIASHLETEALEDEVDFNECNCKLAAKISDDTRTPNHVTVVHGKSAICQITVTARTETSMRQELSSLLGNEVYAEKKVIFIGGKRDDDTSDLFTQQPVIAVCSRHRHTPAHEARDDLDDSVKERVLDIHSTECPIHPACFDVRKEDAGLLELDENGIITIFAVQRGKSSTPKTAHGKNEIFKASPHWQPEVIQSPRGITIFLSSLRVTTALIEGMEGDHKAQDAVLHVVDLLTRFPPALRTFYVLIQGRTPTSAECAALVHSLFEVLGSFLPTSLLGTDRTRLLEGSRLLFGFILESAKSVKLPTLEEATPYLSAFETVDIRDCLTFEPVLRAVNTNEGMMELSLLQAFQTGASLASNQTQDLPLRVEGNTARAILALRSGGYSGDVVSFSLQTLRAAYTYGDDGDIDRAIDLNQLSELEHLAELCGRNNLVACQPTQLTTAVAPCLTFIDHGDQREALLGVYTGEEGCANPGESSVIFLPQNGETTRDLAILENSIADSLQQHRADGTAVLDAVGGSVSRRLQEPDEVLLFCVDVSASMRQSSDFHEVNEVEAAPPPESQTQSLVDGEYYARVSLDDMKERLCDYGSFADMVGIVARGPSWRRNSFAIKVLEILRTMISVEILQRSEELQRLRARRYSDRTSISEAENELEALKGFWAGLKTHETACGDFTVYRATVADSSDVNNRWSWSMNDPMPVMRPVQHLPSLPSDITEIPDDLPHTLMEDAVTSSDGFTYARSDLVQWFGIRRSSPMSGLPLVDTTMQSNASICEKAAAWVRGDDLYSDGENHAPGTNGQPVKKRLRSTTPDPLGFLEVVFDSRLGSFRRKLTRSMSLDTVYRMLSSERCGTLAPAAVSVSDKQIQNGQHITVRIADDEPVGTARGASSNMQGSGSENCLVKVYESDHEMLFGFWVDKAETKLTLASILWKYWRWTFANSLGIPHISQRAIWTDMSKSGDGLRVGRPRESTARLANLLTLAHCFRKLAPETIFREEGESNGGGGPLVLKVQVQGPYRSHERASRLSRLDVLKQIFEAILNRMIAYNYKTHVGLITVSSTAAVKMEVSGLMESLRRATNSMQADGDTALWDSLALAVDKLNEYGRNHPTAKKRIVCISDGNDTNSINTAADVCFRLRKADIVVDTVALGSENNQDLCTVSHICGGYILQPRSLANALAMCEMEVLLALSERPPTTHPVATARDVARFRTTFWSSKRNARVTVVNEDTIPPVRQHPNLMDDFMPLRAATSRPINTSGGSSGNLRTSRLMREMRAIAADGKNRKYDVYVSESNISFWKVVMEGPKGTSYAAGTFMLYLHAEEKYPNFAPKARFITKIRHPNVNPNGRICHSIFDRDWTSDTSMTAVLDTIFGLLMQPEHSDPVNTTITLGYHHDMVEFAEEVRGHVQRHALKTREEWKEELLGEFEVMERTDANEDLYD